MEPEEQIFIDPVDFTEYFGMSLAAEPWTVDEAATKLAVALTGTRCRAEVISDDLNELVETAGNTKLDTSQPEFRKLIRLATRGMVYRNDPDDDPVFDHKPEGPPEGFTIEDAIENSTEGIYWIDPKAELYRQKMTTQTARLLKAFAGGLAKSGYPKRRTKALMRQEINGELDELALRTSYSAMYLLPVLTTVMLKAELGDTRIVGSWVRRLGMIARHSLAEAKG